MGVVTSRDRYRTRFDMKAYRHWKHRAESVIAMEGLLERRSVQYWNNALPKPTKGSQDLGGPPAYIGDKKQHGSFEPRFMSYHFRYAIASKKKDKVQGFILTYNYQGKKTKTGRRSVFTVHKAIEEGSTYRPSSRGYPSDYGPRPIHPHVINFAYKQTLPVLRLILKKEIDRLIKEKGL